jgi:N6-L-threonylcarbamoyladenine synthase
MARDGEVLIDVPYTVKGMDMSFSGILTYFEEVL